MRCIMTTCAMQPQVISVTQKTFLVAQLGIGIPGGTVRVPLSSPKVIGVANSRGERA
jgi:hypothetical protein